MKRLDRSYIGNRITQLRLEADISERTLSEVINKSENYINSITTGRALPSMGSFLDICDYFGITPFDFFYPAAENPKAMKRIYDEIERLSEGNGADDFAVILESLTPSDFRAFLAFMNRYKWNKNQNGRNK